MVRGEHRAGCTAGEHRVGCKATKVTNSRVSEGPVALAPAAPNQRRVCRARVAVDLRDLVHRAGPGASSQNCVQRGFRERASICTATERHCRVRSTLDRRADTRDRVHPRRQIASLSRWSLRPPSRARTQLRAGAGRLKRSPAIAHRPSRSSALALTCLQYSIISTHTLVIDTSILLLTSRYSTPLLVLVRVLTYFVLYGTSYYS